MNKKVNGADTHSTPDQMQMRKPENFAEIAAAGIDVLIAVVNDFAALAATAHTAGAFNFEEQLLSRAKELAGLCGGLQALMVEVKQKQVASLVLPSRFNPPR